MKLALNWLLPSEWRQAIRSLSNLEVVQAKSVVQVAILDVIRVVTESFGLFMLLPILQFVEAGRDPNALAETSRMWRIIVDVLRR